MKNSPSLCCLLALLASCAINVLPGVEGSGVVIEEVREVRDFDSIKVSSLLNVHLTKGDAGTITIKAEDNLISLVDTEVEGSVLELGISGSYNSLIGIQVYVATPTLRAISTSGSSEVFCGGRFESDELSLEASGASEIECAVVVGALEVSATGASQITLSGSAETLAVDVSGASELSSYELIAAEAEVEASGASSVEVHANRLRATARGASSIRYRGLPEDLKSSDSGASTIGPEGT